MVSEPGAGSGIDDVAAGVDRDDGTYLDGAELVGSRSKTALHAAFHSSELSDGGAGTGSYVSMGEQGLRVEGIACGGAPRLYIGTNSGIAKGKVEDAARAYDGYLGGADWQSDSAFFKFTRYAGGCFETKSGTARKADGVHTVNGVFGSQQVGFA